MPMMGKLWNTAGVSFCRRREMVTENPSIDTSSGLSDNDGTIVQAPGGYR
jgi:hypothetical protein